MDMMYTRLGKIAGATLIWAAGTSYGHEVGQHIGGFNSTIGETRTMARVNGRADAPTIINGDLQTYLSLNATMERVTADKDALNNSDYMKTNFPDGRRLDRNLSLDVNGIYIKRSELSIGGGVSGDSVTKTTTKRASVGQWFLGDQLRVGIFGASAETIRPESQILDYDATSISLNPRVVSNSAGLSVKAILNPTTILNAEYTDVQSTERPILHSWLVGAKQFISPCDCAIHGDVARVINTGALDTNMATGELTGTQWSLSYLQSLWKDAHSRISYRYAREDEYTRAYGDHLIYGSDSYTAALSQEFQKARIQGAERPLLVDAAVTRYIQNRNGAATTFEMGASVKF